MDELLHLGQRLGRTEGVELLPPLDEAALVAFERAHAIRLPDDFRDFLSRVAGGLWMHEEPALFSLDDIALVLADQGSSPSRSFAYDAVDTERLRAHLSGPRAAGGLLEDGAFLALQKQHDDPGCLPLTDHGCDERRVLVVTGPLRGHVWRLGQLDLPESHILYQPRPAATGWAPITFATWLPLRAKHFLGA